MPDPTVLYASDEAIAIRASGDWPVIVPLDQVLARGDDGQFAPGSWTLISPTTDFGAAGIGAGSVVLISQGARSATPAFRGLEEFASDGGSGETLPTRRKGMAAGQGRPPAPAGISAVTFDCRTLRPQIVRATYDLNRRYGVDEDIKGRTAEDLYDVLELREACVLSVLKDQYLQASRVGGEAADVLMAKSKRYASELDDLLDRVDVKWNQLPATPDCPFPPGREPSTSRFGMRISR